MGGKKTRFRGMSWRWPPLPSLVYIAGLLILLLASDKGPVLSPAVWVALTSAAIAFELLWAITGKLQAMIALTAWMTVYAIVRSVAYLSLGSWNPTGVWTLVLAGIIVRWIALVREA